MEADSLHGFISFAFETASKEMPHTEPCTQGENAVGYNTACKQCKQTERNNSGVST